MTSRLLSFLVASLMALVVLLLLAPVRSAEGATRPGEPSGAQPLAMPGSAQSDRESGWSPKDGDLWLMAGNPSPENELHRLYMAAFWFARYPGVRFGVRSVGAAGASMETLMGQFGKLTAGENPTLVSVEPGPGDWNGWFLHRLDFLNDPGSPPKALLDRLREANTRLYILVAPTGGAPSSAGSSSKDDFLLKLEGFARRNNLPFANPTDSLAALGPSYQQLPMEAQQLLVAALLLQELGADGLDSAATLDAGACRVLSTTRAAVSDLKCQDGALRFRRLDEALPFPIPANARAALSINQEVAGGSPRDLFGMCRCMLTVTGLPAGHYVVSIDGEKVAAADAHELAVGLNVGLAPTGPLTRQGQQILAAAAAALHDPGADSAVRAAARPVEHLWTIRRVD